jgi:hypothetical protein
MPRAARWQLKGGIAMPDVRDKKQAKARERRQQRKHPGNNNTLPNNGILDAEATPGDIARDITNDGVQFDPANRERRLNP